MFDDSSINSVGVEDEKHRDNDIPFCTLCSSIYLLHVDTAIFHSVIEWRKWEIIGDILGQSTVSS